MPNGQTGRSGWLLRRHDVAVKVALSVFAVVIVPLVTWLGATTISHGDQLAESVAKLDRATSDQEKAEAERGVIYRRVERLDERTQNIQRSIDRQSEQLERLDDKLDTILQQVGGQ